MFFISSFISQAVERFLNMEVNFLQAFFLIAFPILAAAAGVTAWITNGIINIVIAAAEKKKGSNHEIIGIFGSNKSGRQNQDHRREPGK